METIKIKGERKSFIDLFQNSNNIEIPVIQRDYAQGRKNQKEVRDLFLDALYNYLSEGKPNRDLDFIYGSTENNNFIPLDGQQRLTTLFLLHWYLSIISKNSLSFKDLLKINTNSKFRYKTRVSSAEFCDAIISNIFDNLDEFHNKELQFKSISDFIKNKSWFISEWNYDPTVKSMLVMIDSIHLKFKDCPHFYNLLIDQNNPVITFIYLDLVGLQLTEDLYIKMNSRGKPLTIFENFKAKLEQEIDILFKDDNTTFKLELDTDIREVSPKEYFSFKIDAVWSNLFWNYRHLVGDPNTYDDELMNFISLVFSYKYITDNSRHDDLDLLLESQIFDNDGENISFNKIKSIGAITKSSILFLINVFDKLQNKNDKINNYIEDKFYFNENSIFEKALENKLNFPERVQFFAYLSYILNYDPLSTYFSDWMRIIHNLTENTRFEKEIFIPTIKSTANLIPNAKNIIEYLCSSKCKIDSFYSVQVTEEIIKAKLIRKNYNNWSDEIKRIERLIFHKGQIGYLLEFSGLIECHNSKNFDFNSEEESNYLHLFQDYTLKSCSLFALIDKNEDYILQRSILTKGNFLVPATSHRLNFSSSSRVKNYPRDFSWKRILRLQDDNDKDLWIKKRNFIKAVFDDDRFDSNNVILSLNKFLKDVPDDWRSFFVLNPNLISYCGQGYIYKYKNDIRLYNASLMNHTNIDMRVYNLYTTLFETLKPIDPFNFVSFEEVTGDKWSFIYLTGFCYKSINYEINIYFDPFINNGEYTVVFKKSKGEQSQHLYNQTIIDDLTINKFKWNLDTKNFDKKVSTDKKVYDLVTSLIASFSNL